MIEVKNGSGRARCVICQEIVPKGENNQVNITSYKFRESCHRDCIIHWERIKIIKGLE
jgi:hypothetical protein